MDTLIETARNRTERVALWFILIGLACGFRANATVFQLRNGDCLTGTIRSEGTNGVEILTSWGSEIIIPLEFIGSREEPLPKEVRPAPTTKAASDIAPTTNWRASPADMLTARGTNTTGATAVLEAQQVKIWLADARFGLDLIHGNKDRQNYYGQFSLTHTVPHAKNASEFLRNKLEYRVDYAETAGVESANKMNGSNKTDWDLSPDWFVYNYLSAGYDEVRKIHSQYEIGPGMGYHWLRRKVLVANLESGFSYQMQDRANSREVDATYGRFGEDFKWKLHPQITLGQRGTLLTRVDNPRQMQLRTEANLALALVKNLSLNLTAVELYDTHPVNGVDGNEFQLRSSIGVIF